MSLRPPIFALTLLLCTLGVRSGTTQAPGTTSAPLKSSRVSGLIEDTDGDSIAGAQVTLLREGLPPKTALVRDDGSFHIDGVDPGPFRIAVNAKGFAQRSASGVARAGEDLQLPPIVLEAGAEQNVNVTISRTELALVEVKAEEHQRLLGVIPNFFVVYDWKAPPLTTRQKFELSWKSILDPANLAINAGIAGIEQATNQFSGYGSGPAAYGKRYGAGLADLTTGTIIGGAILPSLFHQDPRYFYKGTGSIKSRFFYALSTAVICRGDNGRWQPNYSSVLGDLAAGAISNTYYPASDRSGATLTIENGLLNAAYDGLGNVVQEFVLKRLTPKVPNYSTP